MPNVLVVDLWMPTPDRDAASVRIVNLLMLLKELADSVAFAVDEFSPQRRSVVELPEAGIDVLNRSVDWSLEERVG